MIDSHSFLRKIVLLTVSSKFGILFGFWSASLNPMCWMNKIIFFQVSMYEYVVWNTYGIQWKPSSRCKLIDLIFRNLNSCSVVGPQTVWTQFWHDFRPIAFSMTHKVGIQIEIWSDTEKEFPGLSVASIFFLFQFMAKTNLSVLLLDFSLTSVVFPTRI